RHLSEPLPRARDLAEVLLAIGEVEQRPHGWIEAVALFEATARRLVVGLLGSLTASPEQRLGAGSVHALGEGGARQRRQRRAADEQQSEQEHVLKIDGRTGWVCRAAARTPGAAASSAWAWGEPAGGRSRRWRRPWGALPLAPPRHRTAGLFQGQAVSRRPTRPAVAAPSSRRAGPSRLPPGSGSAPPVRPGRRALPPPDRRAAASGRSLRQSRRRRRQPSPERRGPPRRTRSYWGRGCSGSWTRC